jgi:hypothetical protein
MMIQLYEHRPRGVGFLGCYDIAAGIMRHVKQERIERVYLVGKGPQRAIRKLQLNHWVEYERLNDSIKLPFIQLSIVARQLWRNRVSIPKSIILFRDGDAMESFLCNWSKPSYTLPSR